MRPLHVSVLALLLTQCPCDAAPALARERLDALSRRAQFGREFRFAIVADPQVGHADDPHEVAVSTRRNLVKTVEEINAAKPPVAFVVFLGDLVNVFDEESVHNFEDCIRPLKAQPVLVHGNHDTRPPFDGYRTLNKRVCGIEDMWYSFDAGDWHFVVLACNLGGTQLEQRELAAQMVDWLDTDLAANAHRPTMVFEHFHLLPQGLTQLEWYTFPLGLRLRLLDALARNGNVRFFFNGHVHNGIKASVKTSWRYRGIDFITVPTGTRARNFGEEFPEFARGPMDGGYYLVVVVQGGKVLLKGRLAGEPVEFDYPAKLREFREELEPRWFKPVTAMEPVAGLINGDFADGLKGWQVCHRYVADENPGFVWRPCRKDERTAVFIQTRAIPPEHWSNDEMMEIYQVVRLPEVGSPLFRASYRLDEPFRNGGGYIRLVAMSGLAFKFTMVFHWGENENRMSNTIRSFAEHVQAPGGGANYLRELGRQKQGMYWRIPGEPGAWHDLIVDLAGLYDGAQDKPGAYVGLNADKMLVALGTWVNRNVGSVSAAYFTNVDLAGAGSRIPSAVDGEPLRIGSGVFETEFGAARQLKQKGK